MNKQINNVRQCDVNLSLLVLPYSKVGFTAPLAVGGLLASYLPNFFFSFFLFSSPSSREKISQRESNCQPLHLGKSTSSLLPDSLESSQT